MKWLAEMKPNVRGWFILVCGLSMLYLHWFGLLRGGKPTFLTAFTTPWILIIGLMFLIYPQIQQRQLSLSWLANNKLHWKANVVFVLVCIVVGLLHYQLQKHIFGY